MDIESRISQALKLVTNRRHGVYLYWYRAPEYKILTLTDCKSAADALEKLRRYEEKWGVLT